MDHVPFGPAAGTCRDATLAGQFAKAGAKIVTYGSVTWAAQAPNAGDNFWFDEETGDSVNALGIGNKGTPGHLDDIIEAKRLVNAEGAELWVSGSAGKTADPRDYYNIARTLQTHKAADVGEANFSCGNMMVNGKYKPIICYDKVALRESMAAFCEGAANMDTAAKLTPTTDQGVVEDMVEACLDYGFRYIILANTVPNCYFEKPDGTPAISMRRGGGGGRMLAPIVTSMLQMIKPLVKDTPVKLIAAGGILEGWHAHHYLKHGADGFVYSTALWRRNFDPKVTGEIILGDMQGEIPLLGLVDFMLSYGLPD